MKLEALNFTTIGRSVRRDYPNSFPGTAIKEVPKRVKSIILKYVDGELSCVKEIFPNFISSKETYLFVHLNNS